MFSWKVCGGPQLGNLMVGWSENLYWTPARGYGKNFGWKFWNDPRLGGSEGFLAENRESEALGETDGDVFRLSER